MYVYNYFIHAYLLSYKYNAVKWHLIWYNIVGYNFICAYPSTYIWLHIYIYTLYIYIHTHTHIYIHYIYCTFIYIYRQQWCSRHINLWMIQRMGHVVASILWPCLQWLAKAMDEIKRRCNNSNALAARKRLSRVIGTALRLFDWLLWEITIFAG